MSRIRRLAPICLAAILVLGSLGEPAVASVSSRSRRVVVERPSSYGTSRGTILPTATPVRADTISGVGAAPGVLANFDAIPRMGPKWPADPTGAMGIDWVLTAANTSYALYDLSGAPVLGPASFAHFFSFPRGTRVSDPKVVYDQYNQVFVMAFLALNQGERRSWILLVAIPNATASDQTTWCGSKIVADRLAGDGSQWADYTGLGYDLDRVAITTNMYDFAGGGGFVYAQVLSFPKAELYDCSRTLTFDTFTAKKTRNPDRTQAFGIQPASSAGTGPRTQYFMSFEARGSRVVLWRLKEAASGAKLVKVALPVSKVREASSATQGGGVLTKPNTWWDPGDLRFVNAFYDADLDRVYAAHTIARNLRPDIVTGRYLEAVVRWYEVKPGVAIANSQVMRYGVVGAPETDAGWPVVATDGSGDLFVAYSRASAVTGEFLSAWVAAIARGATTGESSLLAAGQARMEAVRGPEPWGRSSAIARDPTNPGMMAIVAEYAKTDGSGPTKDWQETFALVSLG